MTEPFYAPRFEVLMSGLTLAADLTEQVVGLTVETDLDLAGTFSLMVRNGDNQLLDSALLDIGKSVEIHLGYGHDLHPAFLGEIASVEPSFPQDGAPTIQITGYDKSFKLRRNQPAPTTYGLTTPTLIAARIAALNGLVPVVDPTPDLPEALTQTESDFAFLKSLAAPHAFDVFVEWDRLHFQLPRPQFAAQILEWGRNLSSFNARISAAGLAGLQVVRGYNQELAQSVYAAALAMDVSADNLVERLGSSAMDLLTTLVREGVRDHKVTNPLSALEVAKSVLTDLMAGMYEGQGSCVGLPELVAGKYVEIRGVGKRFSGTYRARKVTHRIDSGGFRTDFSITQRGQSSLLGLLRKHAVQLPAPDRAEKFYGVKVGVVDSNNELAGAAVPLGRVKVRFPDLSDSVESTWAPCAQPAAGDGSGLYWLPEEGDQVLVAFRDGDFSQPYVVGSLWNAARRPPASNLDGSNSQRVIRTPAGHAITFDDSAQSPSVTVQDAGGSRVVLDSTTGKVTVHSEGNLEIGATGAVSLSAGTDITLSAKGEIHLEAAAGTTKVAMTATSVDVT
ncbi:phage baseplate assembly protein V [Streptomyces sp. NBC_00124]|uniref:phage baseplate assembly protein V n=1 Tax=Streptomyces sp. NBC_00124 TaxID=2975662 RepID=UPI00224FAD83|nr:phage baseplate assembly protein V [Streptomyces sp. NBC_00124]MCX5357761.1 phage baseplate assembly protein V [Streptomyces sp. NBC_00124]